MEKSLEYLSFIVDFIGEIVKEANKVFESVGEINAVVFLIFFFMLSAIVFFLKAGKFSISGRISEDMLYLRSASSGLAIGLMLRGSTGRYSLMFCFNVSVESGIAEIGLSTSTGEIPVITVIFRSALVLLRLVGGGSLLSLAVRV